MVSVGDSLALGLYLLESESERRNRIFNFEAFLKNFFTLYRAAFCRVFASVCRRSVASVLNFAKMQVIVFSIIYVFYSCGQQGCCNQVLDSPT